VITLPVDAADAPAAGGSSSFAVMTGAGCAYTIESDSSWLEVSSTDTGVEYDVDEHDGSERVAVITITSATSDSSATFTVTQSSGCSLMLTPGDVSVTAESTTVSFEVATGAGCTISAITESEFISGITIDGTTIEAEIAANEGDERMAIIVVTAGDSMGEFVVQQDAADEPEPTDGGTDAGEDAGWNPPDSGLSDAGMRPDSGYDFDDLEVGGGCNCHVAGQDRGLPNGLGAMLIGLLFAWRLKRRRDR
jgi:MYXO-CTERM domain-containing protein